MKSSGLGSGLGRFHRASIQEGRRSLHQSADGAREAPRPTDSSASQHSDERSSSSSRSFLRRISVRSRDSSDTDATSLFSLEKVGLKPVYEPPDGAEPDVDIVFVHGLNGHWHNTWFHRASGVYWPRDLLGCDVAHAKVWSFGYNADVVKLFGPVGASTLRQHSLALVSDVARQCRAHGGLIFVAHSLGGLVVKAALYLSAGSAESHLALVHCRTLGVAFLGTPHRGSDLAAYGKIMGDILRASLKRVNTELLALLKNNSATLSEVEDLFATWLRKRETPFHLTCFYEDLGLLAVGPVVSKTSACIPGYLGLPIDANHMDMARFSSTLDTGYQRIKEELLRWFVLKVKQPAITSPLHVRDLRADPLKEECLRSLHYDDIGAAESAIDDPLPDSFSWAWSNHESSVLSWTRSQQSIYWVRGKPGSGKSTFMKHIASSIRSMHKKSPEAAFSVVATHFFRFDGSPLERSIEGFLRAILWQVLRRHEQTFETLMPLFFDIKLNRSTVTWKANDLETALLNICQALPKPILVFLDALDEFGDGFRIATYCRGLAEKCSPSLKLCMSSRDNPDIFHALNNNEPCSGIAMEWFVSEDIRHYVFNACSPLLKNPSFRPIVDNILLRANGVFLWVKIVTTILLQGWRRREPANRIEERMARIPSKLSQLYQDILIQMNDGDREDLLDMLMITAAARQPLSVGDFHWVFEHKQPPLELQTLDYPVDERISAIGSGFLEVRDGLVHLSHETVLAFLRAIMSKNTASLIDDIEDNGELYLANACIWRLKTITAGFDSGIELSQHPFARYAVLWYSSHRRSVFLCDLQYSDHLLPGSLISTEKYIMWKVHYLSIFFDANLTSERLTSLVPSWLIQLAVVWQSINQTTDPMDRSSNQLGFIPSAATILPEPFSIEFQLARNVHVQAIVQSRGLNAATLDYLIRSSGHSEYNLMPSGTDDRSRQMLEFTRQLHPFEWMTITSSAIENTGSTYGPSSTSSAASTKPPSWRLLARHSGNLHLSQEVARLAVISAYGYDPGIRRNIGTNYGPCLQFASHNCFPYLVKILLHYGGNPNHIDPTSPFGSPLLAAIYGLPLLTKENQYFQVLVIETLLKNGANPNLEAEGTETGAHSQTPTQAVIRVDRALARQDSHYTGLWSLIQTVFLLLKYKAKATVPLPSTLYAPHTRVHQLRGSLDFAPTHAVYPHSVASGRLRAKYRPSRLSRSTMRIKLS
ncbi:hypothetical protein GQ53DRAFT_151968 [Thozetella sp. PMI_491]|nr:hypothetical protein GQ53DRAFT_151968 [Thozetella sp. PMI_491]